MTGGRDSRLVRWILWPRAWLAVAVMAALYDVWGSRYNLNPDGIAYIEMARHALVLGPHELINGLWSPGYPGLLMWPLSLTGVGSDLLVPALHAANFLLYLMALGLFLRLLGPPARRNGTPDIGLTRYAVAIGSVVFAWIALGSIGLGLITPDFGVVLCVLASAACCIQLERLPHRWSWAVALGLVLGLGYWVKGILLPLNGLLLLLLLLLPPHAARPRAKIAVSALVFALVGLPLVLLVSARVGRLTPGEVGRLNYAWEVDGVTPYVGWLGDSSGQFGTPTHPPRVLQRQPLTLEFATPVRATYPLWFDPSYWYAGLRPRIDFSGQWRVLRQGMADLGQLLLDQWVLIASLAALGLATVRQPERRRDRRVPMVLAIWSAGAAVIYALVHIEPRYLAGFMATGVIAAWAWLSVRTARRALPWVVSAAVVALTLALGLNLQQNTGGFDAGYRPDYLLDAAQMQHAGLHPGDRIGAVGDAFEQYAAFAAGTPITAQVLDSAAYWQLTASGRSALHLRLAAAGVKAILANNVLAGMQAEGWQIMVHPDSSNVGLLLLRAP
ncbi:MAG: hypothetical protein ACRELE_07040 [Gemmatimonadales bacterium]